MPWLPRIALGVVQDNVSGHALRWALLDVLERAGTHVQTFLSQARFEEFDGASTVTGQGPRHLDSWIMSQEACQEIFSHGMRSADLGIVEGRYDPVGVDPKGRWGGSLDTLCRWLDLPRIAVLDVSQLDHCRLPQQPANLAGLLLDGARDNEELFRVQTVLESLWSVPVLGALPMLPQYRERIDKILRPSKPPRDLCRVLGDALASSLDVKRLLEIASIREFSGARPSLYLDGRSAAGLTVAVAYDEAFQCYFPDTLDLLELRGATIRDYSPLSDENLPRGTDLVYLGCGNAQRFADQLSGNHCMKMALRRHVSGGKRIYAECSGLAYLCRQMVLDDGRRLPMADVLPAVAYLNPTPAPVQPVQMRLGCHSWLGNPPSCLRGYLNSRWQIQRIGPLASLAVEPEHRYDLIGHRQVIGSRVHLDFAAQPQFLHRFCRSRPSLASPTLG